MAGAGQFAPIIGSMASSAFGMGGEVAGNFLNQFTRLGAGFGQRLANQPQIWKLSDLASQSAGNMGGFRDTFQNNMYGIQNRINAPNGAFGPIADKVWSNYENTAISTLRGRDNPNASAWITGQVDPNGVPQSNIGTALGAARTDLQSNIAEAKQHLVDDSGLTTDALMTDTRTKLEQNLSQIQQAAASGQLPPAAAAQLEQQARAQAMGTGAEAIKQARAAYADKQASMDLQTTQMLNQFDQFGIGTQQQEQLSIAQGQLQQAGAFAQALESDRNVASWVENMNQALATSIFQSNVGIEDQIRQLMGYGSMLEMEANNQMFGMMAGFTPYPTGVASAMGDSFSNGFMAIGAQQNYNRQMNAQNQSSGWF